jgi:uncharacterized protein (UPF0332 family)
MKRPTDAKAYISKAQRTLATARLLLKEKDTEGACNRAYYAMFYAAHFALLNASGHAVSEFKKHSSLIAAFGKEIVVGLKMDSTLGQAINKVEKQRLLADYIGDPPSLEIAKEAVELAGTFVDAMRAKFMPSKGKV